MSRQYQVLLVSSCGGVLLDLLALEPWWSQHRTTWAVVKAVDTETVLRGQRIYWMEERRLTRPFGAVLGFTAAWRVLKEVRPDVIVSAGSGVAIGFFAAARLLRIPTFWLETFNFIDAQAITGRICARLASEVLVQRPSMLKVHPKGVLLGELY